MSRRELRTFTSMELIGWLLEHGSSLNMHWEERAQAWVVVWLENGQRREGSADNLRGALLQVVEERP